VMTFPPPGDDPWRRHELATRTAGRDVPRESREKK
jgi:hypothetical protein